MKPFIAYLTNEAMDREVSGNQGFYAWDSPDDGAPYPAIITPITDREPKPGELWWWDGDEALVVGAPFGYERRRYVPVICRDELWFGPINDMCRAEVQNDS